MIKKECYFDKKIWKEKKRKNPNVKGNDSKRNHPKKVVREKDKLFETNYIQMNFCSLI